MLSELAKSDPGYYELSILQMAGQALWDSANNIVLEMRGIIQSEQAKRGKGNEIGWQYLLIDQCKAMKSDLESHGFKVGCVVLVFLSFIGESCYLMEHMSRSTIALFSISYKPRGSKIQQVDS